MYDLSWGFVNRKAGFGEQVRSPRFASVCDLTFCLRYHHVARARARSHLHQAELSPEAAARVRLVSSIGLQKERFSLRAGCDPPHNTQRYDAHRQELEAALLRQIVVAPDSEPRNPVHFVVVAGQEDHGQRLRKAPNISRAEQKPAIALFAKCHVENRNIRHVEAKRIECACTVAKRLNPKTARAKKVRVVLANHIVIFQLGQPYRSFKFPSTGLAQSVRPTPNDRITSRPD